MAQAKRRVSLALQGGGSHGAFTWGVLDRLLEDGSFEIEGISGTSAGAMNAIALAAGFAAGGRDGAQQALSDFWRAVAERTPFRALLDSPFNAGQDSSDGQLPALLKSLIAFSRVFSPAQLNPFDINPLREILDEQIDFERIRGGAHGLKLFVIATQVRTGQMRIFENAELDTNVVLASSCLPSLHHPIEIDGEIYWDGAYSGNPAVFPLVFGCESKDVLIVLLHPASRADCPKDANEIWNRVTELSFSATFLREMRAIAYVREETARDFFLRGRIERRIRSLRFYLVEAEELMSQLSLESKLNTHADFLDMLRDQGRERASEWLERYRAGPESAQIDVGARFGG